MKKLFDKDEILFALVWIGAYVLLFGNADALSEAIGAPKALTVCAGLVLSVLLLRFIGRHRLWQYFGLCPFRGKWRDFWYFIPLAVVSSVNLWNGLQLRYDILTCVLHVTAMCFVGFLEEVIFRGLLFRGMCRSGVRSAVLISSLTFGMGHIVNLLLGAPLGETLLQLVYASAVGFCYTAVFYAGGSILPCIVSHVLVNSLSVFAVEPSFGGQLAIAAAQTLLALGYGWKVLKTGRKM